MLREGIIDEVRTIGNTYGWDSEALNVTGYRDFRDVALGAKTVEEGVRDVIRSHMALAKKQLTWFKRNPEIQWLEDETAELRQDRATALVMSFLALK
jgi:tRNA dimethylallyltransferase